MGIKYRGQAKWRAYTDAGAPGVGYKLYTYTPGTTTLKNTYSDSAGASPNTNPIIFDSRGEATIFWNGTYDLKLTTDTDVLVWTASDYGSGEDTVNYGNYNLVTDGGFEDDSNGDGLPDQWTVTTYPTAGAGAGTAALDSATQIEGLYSLKFTSAGDGGGYAVSDYFNVREGAVLSLTAQLQSSVATVRNVIEIIWYTSAKAQISTSTIYDNSTTNPTSWTEKSGDVTVPSTARFAKIRVTGCNSSVAIVGSTWFDAIFIRENRTYNNLNFTNNIAIGAATDTYFDEISGDIYSSYGAYYNGANWIATQTAASIEKLSKAGGKSLYYDTGLTVAASFTPTAIFTVDNTGAIASGSIDFPGTSITNKPQFVTNANYPVFNSTALAADTALTAGTWTTIGPTGSGATYIWTGLDGVPVTADWIEVRIALSMNASAAGLVQLKFSGRPHNGTGTSGSFLTTLAILFDVAATTNDQFINISSAKIPLIDSTNIFEGYWGVANSATHIVSVMLTGYGYN